jgi:hypothetical protein
LNRVKMPRKKKNLNEKSMRVREKFEEFEWKMKRIEGNEQILAVN